MRKSAEYSVRLLNCHPSDGVSTHLTAGNGIDAQLIGIAGRTDMSDMRRITGGASSRIVRSRARLRVRNAALSPERISLATASMAA